MLNRREETSPWAYLITLYLPFGIMNGLFSLFPGTLFKLLDFSNEIIGLMNGLGLVMTLRFIYAPWLDGAATKRKLSLFTLAAAGLFLGFVAVVLFFRPPDEFFLAGMAVPLFFLAFACASHETAADGFYIRALDADDQARFIGIKTAAIRGGILTATMVLMLGATKIAASMGAVGVESADKTGFYVGFGVAYAVAALVMLGFLLYNRTFLPRISSDQPVKHKRFAFLEVLKEYWAQDRVLLMIVFILLYRFGEGFLFLKNAFYLDSVDEGGLAASASAIPYYAILTDLPWTAAGGILGGFVIKWFGIRRTLAPLALCISLPNLAYVAVAWYQPTIPLHIFGEELNLWLFIASSAESFGYGVSFSAMFFYMHIMATESGRNKTSILAISFALMNLGLVVPGMISGFVQGAIGYVGLFLASTLIGLLVLLVIPLLPMPQRGTTADQLALKKAAK